MLDRFAPSLALTAFALALAFACAPASPPAPHEISKNTPSATEGSIYFEQNRGQTDPKVELYARASDYTLFVTETEAVYSIDGRALSMRFAEEGQKLAITGESPLAGVSHYYYGNDPARWQLYVPHYAAMKVAAIKPGIDLVFRGEKGHIEYDLVVAPGADPNAIALSFDGADSIALDDRGNLLTRAGDRTLVHLAPHIYQQLGSERRTINGRYVLEDGGRVRFAIDPWDQSYALVIDPVAMIYSTFLGGDNPANPNSGSFFMPDETILAIAADTGGRAYIAGLTNAIDFPVSSGGFQSQCSTSCQSAFAARLSANGTTLDWATYLGSDGYDRARTIAVDGDETIIAGKAGDYMTFPLVNANWDPTDFADAAVYASSFIVRLAPDGSALFSTLMCADIHDFAIDAVGDIFVTGAAGPADDPMTEDVVEGCFPDPDVESSGFVAHLDGENATLLNIGYAGSGFDIEIGEDGFIYLCDGSILKLDPSATTVEWRRSFPVVINDIAVDHRGSVYAAGTTTDATLPTTPGAFQAEYHGVLHDYMTASSIRSIGDAYIFKLTPEGDGLVYATYLGGAGSEEATGIAVDRSGSAYVTGWVGDPGPGQSPYQFLQFGAVVGFGLGYRDLFVTRFDPHGREAVFSLKLGGWNYDRGNAIAVDGAGNAYVGGFTRSYDFPLATPIGTRVLQGGLAGFEFVNNVMPADGFVMKLHDDRIFRDEPPTSPEILFEPTVGETPSAGDDGDPISTFSGELYTDETPDLDLGGPMPVLFQRHYASGLGTTGSLGPSWRHNFEVSLERTEQTIEILDWNGRRIHFYLEGTEWRQTGAMDMRYHLDVSGSGYELTSISTEIEYGFDTTGKLTRITGARGRSLTIMYGASGPSQVSDGLGRTLTFSYAGGHLTSVSDGTRSIALQYTGALLTGVTDALNRTTTYEYDTAHAAPGLLTRKVLPDGSVPYTQTFNADGRVATQTAAASGTRTYVYEGTRTTIIDDAGNEMQHVHSRDGRLLAIRNALSSTITIGYSGVGGRGRVTSAAGLATEREYHGASGKSAAVVSPNGSRTEQTFTARASGSTTVYDVNEIIFSDGTSRELARDANGNITAVVDEAANTWSYAYDANGQLISAATPLGGATIYTYNADGTLASSADAAGNLETYGYDALHRKTRTTWADGTFTTTAYDAADQISSITDELGGITAFGYDAASNLTTVTTPDNQVTTFRYDAERRLLGISDPEGRGPTFEYDTLGRLSVATDPASTTTEYEYDAIGNITTVRDPAGNEWTKTYDDERQLTSVTSPLGATTLYAQDDVSGESSVTLPSGAVRRVQVDAFGQISIITDAAGNAIHIDRDELGNVATFGLPGGDTMRFVRNGLGQVTSATDPNGEEWPWAYDDQARLISSSDPLGNDTQYTYDARSRISRITYANGGTQDITYDGTGNVLRRLYSDGTDLSYTYDSLGRRTAGTNLALAYDRAGNLTSSNGVAIARDAGGRIGTITMAAGKTVQYAYNARGALSSITDWVSGTTSFAYDVDGRLTTITRPNGVVTTNTYDVDNQLASFVDTRAASTLASATLTRDVRGLVTSATRVVPQQPSATTLLAYSATYDAASQLNGVTHDVLGRVTADGVRTFVWDLGDRLTSFTQAAATRSYVYNAVGLPTQETAGAVVRRYAWNHAFGLNAISVVRTASADLRYYVHTPAGELLYSIEASTGARHFYHFDEVGNTIFLTDDAGAITDSYAYAPYGVITASSGTTENPFTFNGRTGAMRLGSTTLYRMGTRIYDAATHRFLSRDPSDNRLSAKTIDPYLFAAANPLIYIDATGQDPETPQSTKDTLKDVALELGGGLLGKVSEEAGELSDLYDEKAESLTRLNRTNIFSGRRVEFSKAQELLETAHTFKTVQRITGYAGKYSGVVSTANSVVAGATDILKSPDRKEAANQIAKDYLLNKVEEKGKEAVKEAIGNTAFGALEAGNEIRKGYNEITDITNQTKGLQDEALTTLFNQQDAILKAFKRGEITEEEELKRVHATNEAFDLQLNGGTKSGMADIGLAWERTQRHAVLKFFGL